MKNNELASVSSLIAQLDELIVIDWAKKKEEEHYKQTEEDQAWAEHRGWSHKSL